MKKVFILCTLLMFAVAMSAQSGQTILKQTVSKTLTASYAAIAKDSVTFEIQSLRDISIQIKPTLAAGADSVYTTVKAYVSNMDGSTATSWTPIYCNDTYDVFGDTLLRANAAVANNAWSISKTSLSNVQIKFIITNLDNTNEDNVFKFYYVAKPAYTFSR